MKNIFIFLALFTCLGLKAQKEDTFKKHDGNNLAIEKTTEVIISRDEIRQRIREYDKAIEYLQAQRQIQLDLDAKCEELKIVAATDTADIVTPTPVIRSNTAPATLTSEGRITTKTTTGTTKPPKGLKTAKANKAK